MIRIKMNENKLKTLSKIKNLNKDEPKSMNLIIKNEKNNSEQKRIIDYII
jgi:hypothetical protein